MKNYTHILRTLVIAGTAATLAVAQSNPTGGTAKSQSGGTTTSQSSATATSQSGSAGSESMVGKTDHQFMMEAAMGGMMEVQLAQTAQQKASSQEVKDYARRLEQDHSKANDQLKSIAQQRQVSLPTDIGEKHKAMVTKLNAMSGPEFDRAYINAMVQDHRKDIKAFEQESNRGMDSDVKNFASTTLPTLREHLQMAEQLQNSTRSRKADKASSNSSSSSSSSSSTNATSK